MKQTTNVEILVEEPSAERALRVLLPRVIPDILCNIRPFRGKPDLLRALPQRLAGYATYIRSTGTKVVVLVDRDDDECHELRNILDSCAQTAGLRVDSDSESGDVLNRIVIEELEAWYFGDVAALCTAYPRVPVTLGSRAGLRDPDAVTGGTWETLERVLRQHGYHQTGLRKLEVADGIAPHMDVETNRSRSFEVFRDGLRRLVKGA